MNGEIQHFLYSGILLAKKDFEQLPLATTEVLMELSLFMMSQIR